MKIGYARVSTLDQNPDLQKDALEKAGCEKVIVDQISGTVAQRPGLEKVKELLTEIYRVGVALGGTISGEHGLGFAKKGYLPIAADESKIALMKRIKCAFDPNNIMNPGKVLDPG